MTTKPLPKPSAWSEPFWKAAGEGRLIYQFCTEAGQAVMYPKRLSPYTLRDSLEWRDSAGRGEIYTYTVQRLAAPSGFEEDPPYVLAVVRLDEGFQMMAQIITETPDDIRCGDRVRVVFVRTAGDIALPAFEIEGAA